MNNEDEANNYFKISAEKGDLLGKIKSLKFEEIDDSLIDEIRSVVEKNDYYAYYELGNYYLETTDNAKKNEGVQLIKEASENNIFIAKARLGVLYDEGEIVREILIKLLSCIKVQLMKVFLVLFFHWLCVMVLVMALKKVMKKL